MYIVVGLGTILATIFLVILWLGLKGGDSDD